MSCVCDICYVLLFLIVVGFGLMLKIESYIKLYILKIVDRSYVFCLNRDVWFE